MSALDCFERRFPATGGERGAATVGKATSTSGETWTAATGSNTAVSATAET